MTLIQLQTGHDDLVSSDDILRMIYSGSHDTDVGCDSTGCDTIDALKLRVVHSGNYLIKIQLTNLDSFRPYVSSISFNIFVTSPSFILFLVIERAVLFVLAIVLLVVFECRLCKVKDPSLRLFEQKAIRWLNIALVLYYEPVSSLEYLIPSTFS